MRESSTATAKHACASAIDTTNAFAHADANTCSGAGADTVAQREA